MKFPIACLATLALALGCNGPAIHYDYDAKAGYATFHSYDWYAAPPAAQPSVNPFVDSRVRAAVESVLAARHFEKETRADPDFLVTYYPIYHSVGPSRARVGFGGFLMPGLAIGVSQPIASGPRRHVGSIVLEIQDFKTHQLVWKAEAPDVLDDAATPEDSQQDVTAAVTKMLGQFPPKAPAS